MKWKILLTDGLAEINDPEMLASVELIDRKGITPEELLGVIPEMDAVIVRGRTKITEEVLAKAENLKVVGRMGVGVDNIDLKSAVAHGVTVVNTPVSTTVSVAELTLGLMLSLIRSIPKADAGLKAEKWLKKELVGSELYNKTLGIIGFGNIAGAVCQRASAFGMRVIAYDYYRTAEDIQNCGAEPLSFDELLAQSDIITMHLPHTPETHYMINAESISKMKDGVLIICAARGGVIEESALLEALDNGKVAGAALDVFEAEPPPAGDPLSTHPKVVGTPHIGAQTQEAQLRAGYDIVSEVIAVLEGNPARWKVA
jgi:D-3-phosphoglycerate dehydrogenase